MHRLLHMYFLSFPWLNLVVLNASCGLMYISVLTLLMIAFISGHLLRITVLESVTCSHLSCSFPDTCLVRQGSGNEHDKWLQVTDSGTVTHKWIRRTAVRKKSAVYVGLICCLWENNIGKQHSHEIIGNVFWLFFTFMNIENKQLWPSRWLFWHTIILYRPQWGHCTIINTTLLVCILN